MQALNAIDEPVYTTSEVARSRKLNPATIRKLFVDEPGTIRLGPRRSASPENGNSFTLRIPHSVAKRVFERLTVGGSRCSASEETKKPATAEQAAAGQEDFSQRS